VSALRRLGPQLFEPSTWQTRMALFLGVDPSTVRRWLSGTSQVPGPAIVALNLYAEKQTWQQTKSKP
jgi:hypothetical protein